MSIKILMLNLKNKIMFWMLEIAFCHFSAGKIKISLKFILTLIRLSELFEYKIKLD